jgi:hypothetical protein
MNVKEQEMDERASCPICGRELNKKEALQFNKEGKFECEDCGATVAPSGTTTEGNQHFENHGCGCGGSCGCGGHHQ